MFQIQNMDSFFSKIYTYISTILSGSKKWWALAAVCAGIALYLNFGGSGEATDTTVPTTDSTEIKIDSLQDTLPRLVR